MASEALLQEFAEAAEASRAPKRPRREGEEGEQVEQQHRWPLPSSAASPLNLDPQRFEEELERRALSHHLAVASSTQDAALASLASRPLSAFCAHDLPQQVQQSREWQALPRAPTLVLLRSPRRTGLRSWGSSLSPNGRERLQRLRREFRAHYPEQEEEEEAE